MYNLQGLEDLNFYFIMKRKFYVFMVILSCISLSSFAQGDRSFIKDAIKKWGSCRNVALTLTGGDLALNEKNAYACSGIPSHLSEALDELNEEGKLIDDVQLTEDGSWLVLYGNNGFRYYGIPDDLERTIKMYNNDNEVITSVTFNDKGAWIVISSEHITASSSSINSFIEEGIESYGQLWAAHLTNDGMVLCYERGYRFLGNVPENLKKKLKETKLDVYRIKFLSDGTYFIADTDGAYSYYM